jgi:ABC-type Fe3+/spermidine/putrescine transport system ATPase subunit
LREALQDELRVIQRRSGATFLMVTHDRDEAMALADIIIVLNDGKLEQIGTAIDLYRRPANRFVATFFGRANVMCGQVRRNGDECTVIGTGGLMLYKSSGPLPDGAYAEIAVNPEQLKLHMTNCDSSDGRHRGRVKSLKYAGESTWVTFESAEGVLIARTPSEIGSKFFEGDEVDFEVNAAETTFLTTQP